MKQALRYIPTEVWVDVFCYPWITRKWLGRIVDKFRNRYFADILQYCLHERGTQTLGYLQFKKKGIYEYFQYGMYSEKLNVVQTPLPENIKLFEHIEIKHIDSQILDFLRRISTLFNDVNLNFDYFQSNELANRRILDHLTPLIHGIHSLSFDQSAISLVEQYFGPKLAQVKMLSLNLGPFDPAANQTGINFCLDWLTSGVQDQTVPKFLEVYFCSEVQQFSMALKQQFQSANRPSSFVIKFICYDDFDFQLDLENTIGEQLHGHYDGDGNIWIFRHSTDSTRTQLEEWAKEMVEKRDTTSRIEFFPTLTIGMRMLAQMR